MRCARTATDQCTYPFAVAGSEVASVAEDEIDLKTFTSAVGKSSFSFYLYLYDTAAGVLALFAEYKGL
jgi:hypothetical protein